MKEQFFEQKLTLVDVNRKLSARLEKGMQCLMLINSRGKTVVI